MTVPVEEIVPTTHLTKLARNYSTLQARLKKDNLFGDAATCSKKIEEFTAFRTLVTAAKSFKPHDPQKKHAAVFIEALAGIEPYATLHAKMPQALFFLGQAMQHTSFIARGDFMSAIPLCDLNALAKYALSTEEASDKHVELVEAVVNCL